MSEQDAIGYFVQQGEREGKPFTKRELIALVVLLRKALLGIIELYGEGDIEYRTPLLLRRMKDAIAQANTAVTAWEKRHA